MADLTTKTRDQVIAEFQRDYLLRAPEALTGPGTQPYLIGSLVADQLMPLYANTIRAARALDDDQKTDAELRVEADRLGVTLAGAVGSTGSVTIVAATGGTTIFANDELTEPNTKARFYCLTTALYASGSDVPIAARGTGPTTNLDAGTVLQWSSPRAGCATTGTVAATSTGAGLTGGADAEGREQIIQAIRDARANPPGSGNDSEYRVWAKQTPGVQIEEFFVYPDVYGPSTVGWSFTVSPDRYGSRIPSAIQIALVRQQLAASAPRTDLQFYLAMSAQAVNICAELSWDPLATGWADESPWPAYFATSGAGSGAVLVSASSHPLSCTLATSDGDYSTCGDPVAGQTIAFFDLANGVFRRKKIATVVGAGPWDLTFSNTLNASDNTFTPAVGQRAMPWSDSLDLLVPPVTAHFAAMGPGEAKATTYLDGARARRDPPAPKQWPERVTKALEASLEGLDEVESLDLVEGNGTVAGAHVPPYLLTLVDLAFFPA